MKTLDAELKANNFLNEWATLHDDIEYIYQDLYDYIKKKKKTENQVELTIILPMYNEEKTIKAILEKLPYNNSIEIIVVNDHSVDNSLKEIEKVKSKRDIKIINHERNRGYGRTIMSGISYAKGNVIVTMDSDGQHSPDDILNLIIPIFEREADYTIGSRYKGQYFYQLPIFTRMGEVFVEKLIQIFFGVKVENNQNGFRAFNRKVLPVLFNAKYQGYAFCTELILKIALAGFKIKECPIKVYKREYGKSNIILRKLAVRIFSCLFYYYIKKLKLLI